MKRWLSNLTHPGAVALSLALLPTLATSCSDDGFGRSGTSQRLVVEFVGKNVDLGSRTKPLPLTVGVPQPFKIRIRAENADGSLDETFSRYVRISARPGAVEPLVDKDAEGRNVLLQGGESSDITVQLTNAFGPTFIVASDLGYIPVDPLRDPPPACANGIDDDGDGTIDFPADEGCAFANDDAEEGGTYAEGASPIIFFGLPRIADARGLKCDPDTCSGVGETPYPKQPIQVDTGYHEKLDRNGNTYFDFDFDTVVTRISSSGFYVMDRGDESRLNGQYTGFNSLYSFNFNAPPNMRVCDRMKTFGGTASEFFGFTQMSYPTWTLDEWNPKVRACLVPEAMLLGPSDVGTENASSMLRRSGSLVRVESLVVDGTAIRDAHIGRHFGPERMPAAPGETSGDGKLPVCGFYAVLPSEAGGKPEASITTNASNCDLNGDGRVNFQKLNDGDANLDLDGKNGPDCRAYEADCDARCKSDPECTEYSNYASRSTFMIALSDANGGLNKVQANASAANFNPFANKGAPLRSFEGVLTYFSGGSQFTIEARCADDVVTDMNAAPLPVDHVCETDADCGDFEFSSELKDAGYKRTCFSFPGGGQKACRFVREQGGNTSVQPPRLACVLPRTYSDNNSQQ